MSNQLHVLQLFSLWENHLKVDGNKVGNLRREERNHARISAGKKEEFIQLKVQFR